VDAADAAALGGKQRAHAHVQPVQRRGGDDTTSDDGLIGHHEDRQVQAGKRAHSRESAGHGGKIGPRSHVVGTILVDDPIAVKEDGRLHRRGRRSYAGTSTRSWKAARTLIVMAWLTIRWTSSTISMQSLGTTNATSTMGA